MNFSRTVWITFHWRGITSRVSVMSSPVFTMRSDPRHEHAVGASITTRFRGRGSGKGLRVGRARGVVAAGLVFVTFSAAIPSSVAAASNSSSCSSIRSIGCARRSERRPYPRVGRSGPHRRRDRRPAHPGGARSPQCLDRVLPTTVQGVRLGAGIKIARQRTRWRPEPGRPGVAAMAGRLGIPPEWLDVQIRQGRIVTDRRTNGACPFDDTPQTVEALRNLRSRAVERVDLRAHRHDAEGHRHG